jgi:hypothetical protein
MSMKKGAALLAATGHAVKRTVSLAETTEFTISAVPII